MSDPKPPSRPTPTVATPQAGPSVTRSGSDTLGEPAGGPSALPELIGKYRLLGELGRGGMGVVFRAEDTALKREVALKVMLPQAASNASAKARFLREARAQAKVEHDHVAVIHNVEEHDGLPYLVMPLLKGMTLYEALRANPRPPLAEVIRIGREVAEGLAAAHEQGLVHRDIKPANVWLEGKRLRVKVLDFGLARAVSEEAADGDDGPVTREGAVVGTPAYMSPEQGRGLHVDERTDLFSLGVMLYQMTTGELPFKGANALAILTSLAVDTPAPPIAKNPAVPPALSELVMRLLAKEPKGRPASAEAVADELRAIEESLTNSVRVIALGSAPPPIILGAIGPDPFADLDATETPTAPDSPPPDLPRRAGNVSDRSAFPVWAMAVGVILAVAGVIWFAAQKLRTKPPEVVNQPEDPPKEKDKRPVVVPKPKDVPVDPRVVAMEELLARGVRLHAPDGTILVAGGATPTTVLRAVAAHSGRYRTLFPNADQWMAGTVTTPVSDADLDPIASLPPLTNVGISGLYFTGQNVTDKGVEKLVGFPSVRDITMLWLSHPVGDEGVRHAAKWPRLTQLFLDGSNVTDAGVKHFAGKPLTQLTLRDTLVTDAALPELAKFTALTHLDLRGTRVTEAGYKKLQADLPKCQIAWEDPNRAVVGWLFTRGSPVVALKLPDGKEMQVTKPEDIPRGPFTVYSIALQIPFTDADLKRLELLENLGGIRVLYNLTTEGLRSLLVHKVRLTYLSIHYGPLTDEGLKVVGQLTELAHLGLASTKVTDEGLKHLAPLKKLRALELNSSRGVSDEGVKVVGQFPELGSLNLGDTKVTDEGLKHLVGLNRLGHLLLNDTAVSDAGIETLTRMKSLTELNLQRSRITEPGLKKLQAALPKCKIDWEPPDRAAVGWLLTRDKCSAFVRAGAQELPVSKPSDIPAGEFTLFWIDAGTPFSDADLKRLEPLPGLRLLNLQGGGTFTPDGLRSLLVHKPRLERLLFHNSPLTDEEMKVVGQLTELRYLGLRHSKITDEGIKHLGELKKLTALLLMNTGVSDASVGPLSGMKSLVELDLKGTRVTKDGFDKLQNALTNCKIEWEPTDPDRVAAAWVLSMGGEVSVLVGPDKVVVKTADKLPAQFQLTDVVLKNTAVKDDDLNRLRELSAVIQVNLSGTAVTDAGLRHLAEVKSLRSLWLGGCPGITDAAVPHLRQLPALGNLDLVGTRVGDTGLRELCEMRQLQFLYLSSTKVTDAGIEHLAKLPRLSALHLNSLPVTDKGLARLVGCKALGSLELIDTQVSDAGLAHLKAMTALRALNLSMTKWTEPGVKQLRSALPMCKIVWDPADRVIARWLLARGGFQLMLKLPDGKSVLAGQPEDIPAGAFTVVAISCGQVKFGDEDIKRLEPLTGLTAFSLWNRDPGLSDAGVRSLLKWKSTLTELRLSNQPFTKDGLKVIGGLTELKSLQLDSDTAVADGLAHLAGLSKLELLVVSRSLVGDTQLKHLVGLKLQRLDLSNTSVTDKGLETLAQMKTLRELNLHQTTVTADGVKKLQKALPECKILWEPPKK